MRLLQASLVAAALLAAPAAAFAQSAYDYPWCAVYGTGDGDATNCGFVTREQCMATVSGVGGRCEPNNLYVPQSGAHPDAVSTGKPDHR